MDIKLGTEVDWFANAPLGKLVYQRTYSRTMVDGTKERWPDTCRRVVDGNLGFVDHKFIEEGEAEELYELLLNRQLIPAGRHLWVTGVPGRAFTQNCHIAGFETGFPEHCAFVFSELMKGGGVGANYSSRYLSALTPLSSVAVRFVCSQEHADFEALLPLLGGNKRFDPDNEVRFLIPDSREGWVAALELLIATAANGGGRTIVFDASDVRPQGSLIRGFGGISSGPLPLIRLIRAVANLLPTPMTPQVAMKIDHLIASAVIAGNVRRCLPAETLVHTEGGLVRVDEIRPGDAVAISNGDYAKVSAVFEQGEQETIILQTQTGPFECTPNHRMAVLDSVDGDYRWVEASQLKLGDRLLFVPTVLPGSDTSWPSWSYDKPAHSTTCKNITVPELDPESAWFLGQLHGDGYVAPNMDRNGFNAHIAVACDPALVGCVDRVRTQIERFGVNSNNVLPSDSDGSFKVRAQSKQLAWYLSAFKTANKSIDVPEFILAARPEIRAAYLAGLMDADGSVKTRPVNLVSSVYPDYMRQVQAVYASLGIPTRLTLSRPARGSWKALYKLALVGDRSTNQFLSLVQPYALKQITLPTGRRHLGYGVSNDMIRFSTANKTWKGVWDGTGQMNHDVFEGLYGESPYVPIEVLGLMPGRRTETFDIEVEGAHEFVAQGLLVHNSARMSIVHWNDPAIDWFLQCKADHMDHWSTNISVEIDNDFFRGLLNPESHASSVYEQVLDGMMKNGEPGFYNSAKASEGERTHIASTNPCAEMAMESWEACNLGHVNLAYGTSEDHDRAFRLMARFLIRSSFCDIQDPKQQEVVNANRRIGVGFFGLQEWLALRGVPYSQFNRHGILVDALSHWYAIVRSESDRYADLLGINRPIKCTTIAPTGTVAKLAGTSEGMQPIYAKHYIRRVRYATNDPEVINLLASGVAIEPDICNPGTIVASFPCEDPIVSRVPLQYVEEQHEIEATTLLDLQALIQRYFADNAISLTVNIPAYTDEASANAVRSDLNKALRRSLPHVKGSTVFPEASRPQSPIERITEQQYHALVKVQSINAGISEDLIEDCQGGACPIR